MLLMRWVVAAAPYRVQSIAHGRDRRDLIAQRRGQCAL